PSRHYDRQRPTDRRNARATQPYAAAPPQPAPDALRGTRAAMTAYDIYPAFPQPKKQKNERKRRKKQPTPAAQPSWYSSPYPGTEAPIEKDSQVDFFGPAEPTAAPPDEPAEELTYQVEPNTPQANGDFLDEATDSSAAAPSGETPAAAAPKTRRRSMRRRTSSPYAVRRKSTSEATGENDSSDPHGEVGPKRSRPRRKQVEKSSTVEEEGKNVPELLAGDHIDGDTTEIIGEKDSRRKSSRGSRITKRKAEESAAQQQASSPDILTDEAHKDRESEVPKRTRRSKKTALTSEAPEEPSPVGSVASPKVAEPAPKPKRRSRKRVAQPAQEPSTPTAGVAPAPPEIVVESQGVESARAEVAEPTLAVEGGSREERALQSITEAQPAAVDSATLSQDEAIGEATEVKAAPSENTGVIVSESAPAAQLAEPFAADESEAESAGMEAVAEQSAVSAGVSVVPVEEAPPTPETAPPAAVPTASPSLVHSQRKFYRRHDLPKVHEVLRKGDEILVQVTKEEIGEKGARISTYISLPGRYLVLLPYGNNEGGVSRRVEKFEERRRLKKLQRKLRRDLGIEHMGLIIRTAGMEKTEYELRKDAEFLLKEWKVVQERAANSQAPALVYDDSDILYRLCRDVFDESIEKIIVDNPEYAEKIRGILQNMIPELASRIELYDDPINLFARYEVDEKIRKAGRRRVWLKSGGYIIIDEAEALTAIDVNTGKFVGKDNQEQMILKTNLEAAQVIARELKLRDIGGIIVIDFIDMRDLRNREKLLEEFRALLRKDHAKTAVSGISEFGLVEMTRKRVRQSLRKTIFQECPYCRGSGVVFTQQEIWIHLKNMLVETLEKNYPRPDLVVHVNPMLNDFIEKNCGEAVSRLEQKYGVRITFAPSELIHIEHFNVEKKQRESSVLDTLMGVSPSETSSA
ncbi:MAG: Rne/Rng family ribonuclease, partial [Candidatus Sumerlaeaceae bacterium]|nr:Rne/Rng family ribonuclease [Candidatus Sumerlaeaceae bacterium]